MNSAWVVDMTGESRFEMDLEVVPNSRGFSVMGLNPWTGLLRVKVKAKALEGKANEELCKELGKMFGAKIMVASGHKSRKKRILVEGTAKARLERIIQGLQKP